jgi:hypothetical protein
VIQYCQSSSCKFILCIGVSVTVGTAYERVLHAAGYVTVVRFLYFIGLHVDRVPPSDWALFSCVF